MKKILACFMMALFVASVGMPSLADAEEMRKGGRFAKMDTNSDGKIDLNEFKAKSNERIEAAFKAADANGDGGISPEELRDARKNRKQR